MDNPNQFETNPAKPGYRNPTTGAVNPGYTAPPKTQPPFDAPFFVTTDAYSLNDAVTFNANRYVSLVNGNVGHSPDNSPSFWRLANAATAPLPATAPITTSDVATRTVHLETLTRSLFERLTAVEAKLTAINGATK